MDIPLTVPITSRNGLPYSDSYVANAYKQGKWLAKRPGMTTVLQTTGVGQGGFVLGGLPYAVLGDVIALVVAPFTTYAIPSVTIAGQPYDVQADPPYTTAVFAVLKSTSGMWVFTPASGIVKVTDVNYPATTQRGLAYLDGSYYVLTPAGQIYGSGLNTALTWSSLSFIASMNLTGLNIAIATSFQYVVALGENSLTMYYDAAIPAPASALAYAQGSMVPVGCASGASVQDVGGALFFLGQVKSHRSVQALVNLQLQKVSTPDIESILMLDDLADVRSCVITVAGRLFYLLTLGTTGVTLAYNVAEQDWTYWQSALPQTPVAVSMSYSLVTGLVTVTTIGLTVLTGTQVIIAGATNPIFNGVQTVLTAFLGGFTYSVGFPVMLAGATGVLLVSETGANLILQGTAPASGVVAGGTTLTLYALGPFAVAASIAGQYLVDVSDGRVYLLSATVYTDPDGPIEVLVQTANVDTGNGSRQRVTQALLVGDKVATSAYLRYSDDDYSTWSQWGTIMLGNRRSRVMKLGSTIRRAFQLRHADNTALRIEKLDVEIA